MLASTDPALWCGRLSAALATLALSLSAPLTAQEAPLVLHGATVLPMTADGRALPDHSVVVVGGTIRWIGPMDEAPTDGRVVDAHGRFLIPGLIDAHVHLFDLDQLPLYIANGVTTVFNLSGTPFALEWRERVRAGSLVGPRSFASRPQVKDGAIPAFDTEINLPIGQEEITAFVSAHREHGFEFVKVWSSLAPWAYENLLATTTRSHSSARSRAN